MMRKFILAATGVMLSAVSLMGADARQRLTFDGDWQFKLCSDSADVIHTHFNLLA